MNNAYRVSFRIAASHPALPGHFPGDPIVPGVLLLDHVAQALQAWRGIELSGIAQVKFVHPLRPEQDAQLVFDATAQDIRFRITCGTQPIANGTIASGTLAGGPGA